MNLGAGASESGLEDVRRVHAGGECSCGPVEGVRPPCTNSRDAAHPLCASVQPQIVRATLEIIEISIRRISRLGFPRFGGQTGGPDASGCCSATTWSLAIIRYMRETLERLVFGSSRPNRPRSIVSSHQERECHQNVTKFNENRMKSDTKFRETLIRNETL